MAKGGGAGTGGRGLSDLSVRNLFVFPTLLLLVALNVFPLVWSLGLSFTEYDASDPQTPPRFVGGENYGAALADPDVFRAFHVTAGYVAAAVAIQFVLGFSLALLLNRPFRGRGLVVTLLLVPTMLSPIVVGLFSKLLLEPNYGLVNSALEALGVASPPEWLTDPAWIWPSLVLVDTWQWTPFVMLLSLAGLSAIPPHLYEAAAIDRASGFFRFTRITLPLAGPLLLLAVLFRAVDAFKLFDLVMVLVGKDQALTQTLSISLYLEAFASWNTGTASAMAYLVLVLVVALSNLTIRYLDRVSGGGGSAA